MKARNLIILIVVAVLLCGWAYLSSSRKKRRTEAPADIGKPLLAELQDTERLNSIAAIEFVTAQSTVTVSKVEGKWVSPARYNYPLQFESVRDFLRKLAELKTGQPLAGGLQQMEALNLLSPAGATPAEADKTGTLVNLRKETGETVSSLVVGKEHSRQAPQESPYGRGFGAYPDGRFVAAGGKTCLVKETFSDIPKDGKSWLDTQIANVPASEMVKLTVTDAQGQSITLVREEGGSDMALADLASGEEMNKITVSGLAGVFGWLNFEDVTDPALGDDELGFDSPITLKAETKQGKIYTMTLGSGPAETASRYARFKADFSPPEPKPEKATDVASDDGEDSKAADAEESVQDTEAASVEKAQEEQKKLAGEVKDFNDEVGGWTYVIASHEIKDVTADREHFLKKEEKVEDEEREAAGGEADSEIETEPEPESANVEALPAAVEPQSDPAPSSSTDTEPSAQGDSEPKPALEAAAEPAPENK